MKYISVLIFILLNINLLSAQCTGGDLLFSEYFSGNESQWTKAWGGANCGSTTNATFGILSGKFTVRTARGQICCSTLGGKNDNYLTSNTIQVSSYQGGVVHLSYEIGIKGEMEGLPFSCGSTDEFHSEYSTDGGGNWTPIYQLYGDGCSGCSSGNNWTETYNISECIDLPQNVENFIFRFKIGNQAQTEYYYLDNVELIGLGAILGANSVQQNGTTQLNDVTAGGVWSSLNPTIATVAQDGTVTGVAEGTATIRYSIGCCSVESEITVTVPPPPCQAKYTNIDAEICYGEVYDLNNFYETTTGIYTQTIRMSDGCDSIVTLNLTVLPQITETVYQTICEGEQYVFTCGCIDFTVYESGHYVVSDTLQTAAGCDSIITLDLTVFPLNIKTLNETVCDGESYNFYGTIITESGTYTKTISVSTVSSTDCDTLVTLNLEVIDCNKIDVEPLGEICANDHFITLKINVTSEDVDCYSIEFSQESQNAGFENILCENLNANSEIEIPIPQNSDTTKYVKPDNYLMTLTFMFSDNRKKTFNILFEILYPKWIIEQNWNDVLALLNSRYNGGYKFSKYEWYLDGAKIPNENKSFIYIDLNGGILQMGHQYRAFLTRKDENYGIFTCPFIPEQHTDVSVYPTVVGASTRFSIIAKSAGKASFFTVTGIKLSENQLVENQQNYISAPNFSGVYILVLEYKDGKKEAEKIVVRQ
ncbi:MAG: Ig-like domain-containing protein [Prevotellaceae bacterium]|jgi:hypothetical protein|nr:Ig-like domain-containing protein [Prevotellaceae bacterium]